MKPIKSILITVAIIFSCIVNAQLDTLKYLKQFEANKAQYIGKPFAVLLNDMIQIQPKTVWPVLITNKKSVIRESEFNFCDKEKSFNNVIKLYITWQEEIPRSDIKYCEQKNGFYFTEEERVLYGNKIVKDILVYR
ncbi:hypothetical protein QWZ06_11740 [Chryseobacterium tructae]|uniref:Uncharacterized protein n=1 Tax=Chryseobacterium tructae TaxID=1037380 RepID=A0ABV7XXW7_9FLAO|nr:hypothetical protein [Chryseobacterium tructae]MDN3692907.1 hypothetical protein [Chryseobacterium tructae]